MYAIVDAFGHDVETRETQRELGCIRGRDVAGIAREHERAVQSRRGGERPASRQGQRRMHVLRLTRRCKHRGCGQSGEISAARPAAGIPGQFAQREAAA